MNLAVIKNDCGTICPLLRNIKYTCNDFNTLFYNNSIQSIIKDSNIGTFILIDQYGIKSFNQETFANLLKAKHTDFICFYPSSIIRRFRNHDAISKYIEAHKIDFDKTAPSYTHRVITNYYKSLIPENKEFYLHHFSYLKGSNYYGLIFGTSHSYGMEKFLKVCWKHDPFSGESTENINGDHLPGTLFYKEESTTVKKDKVCTKLENLIYERKITNNKQGLTKAIKLGCEPKLFRDIIRKLKRKGKIKITSGDYNEQSTRIHKVKQYNFEYIK